MQTNIRMETIWNNFELKAPPLLTLTSKRSKFVTQLHAIIEKFFGEYSRYEEEYNETAALLSRLMAKRKNSFRRMHGFKEICKINSALCRLLRLDYKRDLENFRSTLPDVAYEDGTKVYLPTRDCFDYLLFRSIALHKLYIRICGCCIQAAAFCSGNIKLNNFFDICVLIFAVIAKVHHLTNKLNVIAINCYNNLLKYRENFPYNKKSLFLNNIILDFPPLTPEENLMEETSNEKLQMTNGIPASFEQSMLNIQNISDQSVRVKTDCLRRTDIGTFVKRSTKQAKIFNVQKLKTIKSVEHFIAKENKQRATNLSSCITKAIQQHEWLGAIKLFKKKVDNCQQDKAIRLFHKFLSCKMK